MMRLFDPDRCPDCGRFLVAEYVRLRGIPRRTGRLFCWVCEKL